jgi:hypothetical protein
MINTERIVPVTQIDLISLYGLILKLSQSTAPTALEVTTGSGQFTVADAGTYIANEPVMGLNFTATSGTVYFVPAYNYSGFAVNGTAVTTAGDAVLADDRTLYKAVLGSGTVTITKVGF